MKRKNEKVPGFDEIIFENRNKEYGAYDLRKHYDSTTSISILGGIAFCGLLLAAFSFTTEKSTASSGSTIVSLVMSDPIIPDPVKPEIKPPAELAGAIKNLAPVVSADSSENLTALLPTEQLIEDTKNGQINDSAVYTSQPDPIIPPAKDPFIVVEEMPQFPGGNDELMKFIAENISYPEDAIINNIQGRVILKFVVNADGSIDRIEVLRGIDSSLDNEAVRVIKTLPKFRPGKQGGVPVPVWFSLPVLFKLQNN
jgi:periplasmic protein TonB